MRGKRKQHQRRNSRLKKWLLGLFSAVLLMVLLLVVLVNRFLDEEYLVAQIEREISCDASIAQVELSWFGTPTTLTLRDVQLTPRSGDLRAAGAMVKVEQVDLSVRLWQLLKKRIEVTNMELHGAHVSGMLYEDGGSSLEALFESPDEEKKQRRKELHSSSDKEQDQRGGFNAFDHDEFVAALGGFFIRNSSADIILEKSGLRIRCSELNLELAALEIDPKRLKDTDMAKMKMAVNIRLDSTKGWHYGDLYLDGSAASRLFNSQTGNMEPDVEGQFDIGDASWLNTRIPVISEAWDKLDQLEKVGVQIDPLPEKASFGRSESLAAHYHLGKITVRKPLSLWVSDWEVAAIEGSWLQTETNQHMIEAELLASKSASAKFYGLITSAIDYLPGDARDMVAKDMKSQLFRGERFLVRVKSTEELSDPKIRLVDGIPDFADAAEEAGKKILREKAGSLLDRFLND